MDRLDALRRALGRAKNDWDLGYEAEIPSLYDRNNERIDAFNLRKAPLKVVEFGSGEDLTYVRAHLSAHPDDAVLAFDLLGGRYSMEERRRLGIKPPRLEDLPPELVVRDARQSGITARSVDQVAIIMPSSAGQVLGGMVVEARRILKPGGELRIVVEGPMKGDRRGSEWNRRFRVPILALFKNTRFSVEREGTPLDDAYPDTPFIRIYQGNTGCFVFTGRAPIAAKRLRSHRSR